MFRRVFLSLVCALILGLATVPGAVRIITWGDANVDGSVNFADVTCIMYYVTGQPVQINLLNADVSGNGTVSAYDASLLWAWIESNLPPEY